MTEDTAHDLTQRLLDMLEEADLNVLEELEILRDLVAVVLVTGDVDVELFKDSLDERMDDVVACDELLMSTEVGEA